MREEREQGDVGWVSDVVHNLPGSWRAGNSGEEAG